MHIVEFLSDKAHIHCAHCNHVFLSYENEDWDGLAVVLHMGSCHYDKYTEDLALVAEIGKAFDVTDTVVQRISKMRVK